MADLGLQTFDKLYPMLVKKYKNLSIDQNADIPDKINQIVNQLNALGKLSNDVVRDWNTVYNWVMNDGLTTDVNNKIEAMNASGELNSILTSLFNSEIGDLTTLQTVDKTNVVAAINDNVQSLAQKAQHTFYSAEEYGAKGNANYCPNQYGFATWYTDSSMTTQANDDTTAIQNAINACYSAGGGTVQLNGGKRYLITNTITLKDGVFLKGNFATIQSIQNGTFDLLYCETGRFGVSQLYLQGAGYNSTNGRGLVLGNDNNITTGNVSDMSNSYFDTINIKYCKNGLHVNKNTWVVNLINFKIFSCQTGVFCNSSDNIFSHFLIQNCIHDGFYVQYGGNTKFSHMKIIFNGEGLDSTSPYLYAGFNVASMSRCTLSHIECQENYGHGFIFNGTTQCTFQELLADANGYAYIAYPTTYPTVQGYGYEFTGNCSDIYGEIKAVTFKVTKSQLAGLYIDRSCNNIFVDYYVDNNQVQADSILANEVVLKNTSYFINSGILKNMLKTFSLTNMVPGDISQVTDPTASGYSASGGTLSLDSTNHWLVVTPTSTNAQLQINVNFTQGHRYYIRADVQGGVGDKVCLYLMRNGGSYQQIIASNQTSGTAKNRTITTLADTNFHTYSEAVVSPETITYRFYIQDINTGTYTPVKIKNLMVIDITGLDPSTPIDFLDYRITQIFTGSKTFNGFDASLN